MASSLAAAALQRRFVLGPIIALALVSVGTSNGPGSGIQPRPSASASSSPTDQLAGAKRAMQLAYEAESVYKVDNLVFAAGVGDELAELRQIEPRVEWGTGVIVQLPAGEAAGSEVLILRAPLSDGGSLCLSEVGEIKDAGLYYARVAAAAKCPPYKPGMPGWVKDDREKGWG